LHNETIDNLFIRAKEVEKGEWVYGFYVNMIQGEDEIHFIREQQYSEKVATHWQIDPKTICMWIDDGFYEWDICKDENNREYVLRYLRNPLSFFAQVNYFDDETFDAGIGDYAVLDRLKVVGTIFDD